MKYLKVTDEVDFVIFEPEIMEDQILLSAPFVNMGKNSNLWQQKTYKSNVRNAEIPLAA